ncbi:MAG: sigma-54 dependent transcriptional regulator [Chitinophagaceae bacterium]
MQGKRILIIDDEEQLRGLMKRIIGLEGFDVHEAATVKAGLKKLETEAIDVVLCDVKLPDGNGVQLAGELRKKYPTIEMILLTAYGNVTDGVQAMKNGAFDYLVKGDDNDKIIPLLHRALEKAQLAQQVARLQQQLGRTHSFDTILGDSAGIRQAVALAQKVAGADTTVLLLGETGTGKEVFAQAIHQASRRAGQSFVAVNCSAFSRELLESELFGHKAGAFTGAVKDKKGLFEEASHGTLFLDEIGEMPAELQARLLRVLETGEFIKVGDTRTVKVDVRIISATNRHLQAEIETGHFRSDLFYRLSVFQVALPSLRERLKDIPALATHFTALSAARTNKPVPALSAAYLDALQHYQWPGNIRELKNVIERSVILEDGAALTVNSLPVEFRSAPAVAKHSFSSFELAGVEKEHIRKTLLHTNGNKTEAARLLNIGLTTLYRKIAEYNLG